MLALHTPSPSKAMTQWAMRDFNLDLADCEHLAAEPELI